MIWLLFLNILSFNFVPTPNKSLRLTRFRRSYVNRPAVVLIKVTLLFCLICDMQSSHFYFFVHILNPGIFRRLAYSKSKSFSEACQTSTMKHFAKIVTGYNYLHKLWLFLQCKVAAFSTSWNKYHDFLNTDLFISRVSDTM